MYSYIKSPYWKHWSISLIVMGATGYVMSAVDCFEVPNLIAIEFANTASGLTQMILPYLDSDCNALYNNTVLDFGFMLAYTLAFYFSGRIICDLLEFPGRKWLLFLFLPLVLDAIENLSLLYILKNGVTGLSFWGFYYAVRLKWLFVVPSALLLVTVALYQTYVGLDKIYCWWVKVRGKEQA